MNIAQKITFINSTTLESLKDIDRLKIIGRFTQTGIKILAADFGFAYWKRDTDKFYSLAYKSPNMTYEPRLPRQRGHAFRVEKSKKPFMGLVKKERLSKYDMSQYMKSIVIIPIYYKSNVYGSLVLCFKNKRLFSGEERSLSIALGNAAAQAITINRLHSNLKAHRKNLELRVMQRTRQLEESKLKIQQDQAKDNAILSSIGEGILATDKDGRVILMNPQAESMLGWNQEEIKGKLLYEFQELYREDGTKIKPTQRPLHIALKKGKRVTSKIGGGIYYLKKNGEKLPLVITATPVILNKEIMGSIQIFRDISEEKKIDQSKAELISLVSHQLRTPLSAINWYSEALVKNELGPVNHDQKKYLQEIYNANQKMIELVYDFLNVSRLELGTFSIKLSHLNLKDITKQILEGLAPLIKEKKLKVEEKYSGGGLTNLEADKKVLRLTLENLITNAVKYTPSRGTIKINISLEKRGNGKNVLSMAVHDTGYGIPKKQQSKIFTKLFRADNAVKYDTNGSGLGLYLVKSFINYSHGKIWFKSKENKGSSFYVTLPVG